MKKIKKNIFITGGLGQDGKILVSLLDADKYNIFVFSKLTFFEIDDSWFYNCY